jgi:hypothetical protein
MSYITHCKCLKSDIGSTNRVIENADSAQAERIVGSATDLAGVFAARMMATRPIFCSSAAIAGIANSWTRI